MKRKKIERILYDVIADPVTLCLTVAGFWFLSAIIFALFGLMGDSDWWSVAVAFSGSGVVFLWLAWKFRPDPKEMKEE